MRETASRVSIPDDADRLASQFLTPVLLSPPDTLLHFIGRRGNIIHQAQQHAQCMLGNGITISLRAALTPNTSRLSKGNIDQFHAASQSPDPFQFLCFLKKRLVDRKTGSNYK